MRLIMAGLVMLFVFIMTRLNELGIDLSEQVIEASLVTCLLIAFLLAGWWWMRSESQNDED